MSEPPDNGYGEQDQLIKREAGTDLALDTNVI